MYLPGACVLVVVAVVDVDNVPVVKGLVVVVDGEDVAALDRLVFSLVV